MIKKVFFIGLLFCLGTVQATDKKDILSSLKEKKSGQGTVRIFQDPKIEALLRQAVPETIKRGERTLLRSSGYRIQVFAGNNTRAARDHANQIAKEVSQLFPELSVYTTFQSPRWICRVGDFRSIEEADVMLRELRATKKFKEVSIVREQIIIPLD